MRQFRREIGRKQHGSYGTATCTSRPRTAQSGTQSAWSLLPDYRQQQGQICETILTEWLLRQGYYVMRPLAAQGPVDCVAYNDAGQILLIDAKQDAHRTNPGRKNPSRINRIRTPLQTVLGVRTAYVTFEKRAGHFVPALD